MPEQNDDPRVHQCYVMVDGEKKLVTKRRVSAAELRRRRDVELAEKFAAEEAATAKPRSNTGEIEPAAPETVDVAEVKKEIRKREKPEGS